MLIFVLCFLFFKQKTAYEMRISDWSSDVCSSDFEPLPSSQKMCELARTRKSPDRFQTCLCKKTRRNARCQRAFSADQKSSHGFPPRRPEPEPPLPSSLRWKRTSVSKERRRYSPLEPSPELARRSRSVEQSLSMLVPKSYPRTRCLPQIGRASCRERVCQYV